MTRGKKSDKDGNKLRTSTSGSNLSTSVKSSKTNINLATNKNIVTPKDDREKRNDKSSAPSEVGKIIIIF